MNKIINNKQRKLFSNFNGKPAYRENNIPIVIASSNEYAPFLGVLIYSIIVNSNSNNNYDIIVLSKGITAYNRNILNREVGERSNFSIRYFDVTNYLKKYKFHTGYHITIMTYSRLAMIDILDQYDKAIYLDCDVIINDDISNLYNFELNDNLIGAARDTVIAGWVNLEKDAGKVMDFSIRKNQFDYNRETLGVKNTFDYFNAGIILVNLRALKQLYKGEELLQLAAAKDWKWFDQDVLNKICYGKSVILPQSWNVMSHDRTKEGIAAEKLAPKFILNEYMEARKHPKGIHYCGHCIPCFAPYVDNAELFWKYARHTDYYEQILFIMMRNAVHYPNGQLSFIRRIADKLFPKMTKRRELLKKIMPRDSKQFNFLKNIYHKITG